MDPGVDLHARLRIKSAQPKVLVSVDLYSSGEFHLHFLNSDLNNDLNGHIKGLHSRLISFTIGSSSLECHSGLSGLDGDHQDDLVDTQMYRTRNEGSHNDQTGLEASKRSHGGLSVKFMGCGNLQTRPSASSAGHCYCMTKCYDVALESLIQPSAASSDPVSVSKTPPRPFSETSYSPRYGKWGCEYMPSCSSWP